MLPGYILRRKRLCLPPFVALADLWQAGNFFVALAKMGCLVDSEITAEGHHVNVYTRNSYKPIRSKKRNVMVGVLAGFLFIALVMLSYTSMKLMKLSNTTLFGIGNFSIV